MISDTERREVARRLRELDYIDLQESLICAYLDALGIKGYEDWVGIAHRLADLIEPDTTTDTTKTPTDTTKCDRDALLALAEMIGKMQGHSTKEEADAYEAMLKSMSVEIHPVDRDALLALADEMQSELDECEDEHEIVGKLQYRIDRIREALKVNGGVK